MVYDPCINALSLYGPSDCVRVPTLGVFMHMYMHVCLHGAHERVLMND